MTDLYIARESGFGSSAPVEAYHFYYGDQAFFRTSADVTFNWQGNDYLKGVVRRGDLEGLSNPESGTLELTMDLNDPVVQQILTVPPSMPFNLTIFRAQRADLTDFRQQWTGRLRSYEIIGNTINLHGISVLHQEYRLGNPLRYQKSCPYAIYDDYNCQVNPAVLEYVCNPTVSTASKVISPDLIWSAAGIPSGLKEGWFVGGYVTYSDIMSNVIGKRSIIDYNHTTGLVTVYPALRGYTSGAEMKFYPGCRHDTYDCHVKFNNLPNYGGDPILPLEDPFDPTVDPF